MWYNQNSYQSSIGLISFPLYSKHHTGYAIELCQEYHVKTGYLTKQFFNTFQVILSRTNLLQDYCRKIKIWKKVERYSKSLAYRYDILYFCQKDSICIGCTIGISFTYALSLFLFSGYYFDTAIIFTDLYMIGLFFYFWSKSIYKIKDFAILLIKRK